MTTTLKYPTMSLVEQEEATKKDKSYEYRCAGLFDWYGHKLADKGWEGVDPAWPPKGGAAIGWIRRKKVAT